jgi:hypothetical protein
MPRLLLLLWWGWVPVPCTYNIINSAWYRACARERRRLKVIIIIINTSRKDDDNDDDDDDDDDGSYLFFALVSSLKQQACETSNREQASNQINNKP